MSTDIKASATVQNAISLLNAKASLSEVVTKLNELANYVNNIKTRDRGPKSSRIMTNEDAYNVKFGDLKSTSHKEAAVKLGLSYGQVYSARLNYTFLNIKEDFKSSK
jgi:hypothetical protein